MALFLFKIYKYLFIYYDFHKNQTILNKDRYMNTADRSDPGPELSWELLVLKTASWASLQRTPHVPRNEAWRPPWLPVEISIINVAPPSGLIKLISSERRRICSQTRRLTGDQTCCQEKHQTTRSLCRLLTSCSLQNKIPGWTIIKLNSHYFCFTRGSHDAEHLIDQLISKCNLTV